MHGTTTRSASKAKNSTSSRNPVVSNEINVSTNTSYLTIVCDEDEDSNTDTLVNINLRLQNKLAEREEAIEIKEAENGRLRTELKNLRLSLDLKESLITKLEGTIQLISQPKTTLLRDAETQTVDRNVGGETSTVAARKLATDFHSTAVVINLPEFADIIQEEIVMKLSTVSKNYERETRAKLLVLCVNYGRGSSTILDEMI